MGAQPNFGLQGICDREDPFIPRRRQADPLTAFPFDPYRKSKGRLCMCAGVDPLLGILFKSRLKMSDRPRGVSQRQATVPAKEYESSDQRILASGGTVALPSYYRPRDVADAGTRESGE